MLTTAGRRADELVKTADEQLMKARAEAAKLVTDAQAAARQKEAEAQKGAEALRAKVAEHVEAAQRDAQLMRRQASEEAHNTKAQATEEAARLVAAAQAEIDKRRTRSDQELADLEAKRKAMTEEMLRVRGVLDALAGPLNGGAKNSQKAPAPPD
jgi:F0F1-type ATP synthase membrane subunit b/b'